MNTAVVRERELQPPLSCTRPYQLFILGCADEDRALIERMPAESRFAVHELLPRAAFRGVRELPVATMVDEAERLLRQSPVPPDGVLSFIDFPASELMGLLNQRLGLRGPDLRAVLACNHKYWSRQLQAEVVPESVPPFAAFDPFDDDAWDKLPIEPPMWIKPLNAFCSGLGFRVRNRAEFEAGVAKMRCSLDKLSDPLDYFLEQADLPEEIRSLGGHVVLAEGLMSGRQCTLEGFMYEGEPRIYGIVDSVRETNGSSFSRYQYPSILPAGVRARMIDIAERVMRHIGFDNATFNMEFFHDPRTDRIGLVEINPRLSQSHFELFEKVDGVSSQKIAFDLVTGKRPEPPCRRGISATAAKFFIRAFHPGRVTRVPSDAEIRVLQWDYPDLTFKARVREGDDLSALQDQDSYTFELADIWLGAHNQRELLRAWRDIRARLDFRIDGEPVT